MNYFMNKLLFAVLALPLLAASGNAVGDTPTYQVINYNSVLCLAVSSASTSNGATVYQWTCHGGTNQQWRMLNSNAYFTMSPAHSGKCLAVAGASTANGAKVHQWDCQFNADGPAHHQQWSLAVFQLPFEPRNQRTQIRNRHSGKCLEVAGASTSRGAHVRQRTCNGSLNQVWLVE